MYKSLSKCTVFCHDTRYFCDESQHIYPQGAFPYALWCGRFLPFTSHLTVLARQAEGPLPETQILTTHYDRSDGPGVEHILLPNIHTAFRRLFKSKAIKKQINPQVEKSDHVIIRGPCEIGMIAAQAARRHKIPYAVEMSGCAFDHLWYHGSLLAKLYAPIKYWRARQMVKHADHVIYVTQDFLQRRYPTKGQMAVASNVEIASPGPQILEERIQKIENKNSTSFEIGLIGNYGNSLKGLDVAIQALAQLIASGHQVRLNILGSGKVERWKPLIDQYHLHDHVIFHQARPSGSPVLEWLDQMDLYIQPSLHEGLPRALIEAMSRALPCLASNAGGSTELLSVDCIHQKKDRIKLAKQIAEMLSNPERMKEQANHNFAKAQAYTKDRLQSNREAFWRSFFKLRVAR